MAESVVTNEHPEGDATRRDFIHIAAGAAAVGAGVMMVWPLVNSMNPAADTLALSTVEFDTSKVAEGMQIVITWQGKPVFVRNRTAAELTRVIADNDASDLKERQTDQERTKVGHEPMLIVIGSCTHLGCIPTFGSGDYGGWFCPCHGSHYDASGRIRKGPAPKNLVVPNYEFTAGSTIRIG
ncbi:MAG: ubiquinol-cytochrome c reductase iron-sulfur subunit [Brevundimonas subvibrioides]|uniref:Ubiquinol-cytochrome c reductase iron-sulfur subunit n=1 Tax=Brevundimonas subvibrioides TaxID=74313 RepID=A0A258HEA4_9CAUL|nr:ubiquinol-cytochrome c reductase iron-sulfur subunit [Brevundimonas subvibrioides]OYX54934.1 MAG: ubiquinol-cytochrome c reductase iron-sulfur subunit [Brevundimonas subvibrioides]